jgi:hypothetical protein
VQTPACGTACGTAFGDLAQPYLPEKEATHAACSEKLRLKPRGFILRIVDPPMHVLKPRTERKFEAEASQVWFSIEKDNTF